ncbi:chemotaxis protein CheW [Desulfovibrio sp. SGI.169]|uniref:chemotaxis protein CheW n=1 Tax=Desulfovibrio sp. SGI.169 TaxID=3420561 RepID=UPI003D0085CA
MLEPDAALSVAETEHEAEARISLKDWLHGEPRVQMVSFFVRGQVFLLPVAAIQEVLRYVPTVRLPLAPPFVAGVINLRGRVTPLLHLDALLTQEQNYRYTAQSFIIVHASEQMQLGLIIDKIQSMHIVEQNRITWNAEIQLGASADFLCGIADINDRVCGILDPDMIVKKMFAT